MNDQKKSPVDSTGDSAQRDHSADWLEDPQQTAVAKEIIRQSQRMHARQKTSMH